MQSEDGTAQRVIDATDLVAPCRLITTGYHLEEIRTLCSDIEIDYDELGDEDKETKARELIAFLKRHIKLDVLIQHIQESRDVWHPEADYDA